MRKLNLEILPQGSLNLLTLENTLRDKIIMSQLHNEVSKSSDQNYLKERLNTSVSILILKESCGSTDILLYQKIISFENKFLMKLIYPNSLFIPVAPKYIKIYDNIFGGPG
jgi:hypothetical protein